MTDYLYHYGVKGMKWGVRRYQNKDGTRIKAAKEQYSESDNLAQSIYNRAKKLERKITGDVVEAINKSGAEVYGLDHRLKTYESLSRKIYKNSKEKGISLSEAANEINDSLRYTSVSNDNDYVSSYRAIKLHLSDKGYSEERCKNYFDLYRKGKAKHKQITSVFSDKDGNRFEIQFQTPSSINAKELKIPLYEEARRLGVSEKRKTELIKQMERLAVNVKNPTGVYEIMSHSDKDTELRHYGVLGMKWGVRRYQNRDGTLTSKGKNRYKKVRKKQEKKAASQKESAKGKMPKFTKAALLIGGTTIGVIALRLHAKNKREARLAGKDVGVVAGKKFIEGVLGDSKEGIISGITEGTKTGSQTLASVLASGSVLYLGKKAADIMLGKDNAGRVFQAANKKKISSFWTYTEASAKKDSKNDDDDDD